jgi:hypothetical protein
MTLLTNWTNGIRERNPRRRYAETCEARSLHHVMARGIEQRQIVDDEADRADFVRRLGALAAETGRLVRKASPRPRVHSCE